ncbi:DUF2768 domain-containing protein [Halobacillus hunanensis]|uniref:DUF2768 domain-containing protein n=1 Tax=Halobacillus hunanensis TaxID=578214 RepID=UPI0009A8AF73|nr:DUF2768 domain-containing protein [Halobacillus hunanensis]
MSLSMLKMYISFAGILSLFIAIGLIYISRYKSKGLFSIITGIFAYLFMIFGGIVIMYIVFSGPTS